MEKQVSDEQYLEFYEDVKKYPVEMFRPTSVRENYKSFFEKSICPGCSSQIEQENHSSIRDIDYMICEKDGCWTFSYISDKPLDASSYGVSFTSESKLTKLDAAKLAAELWKFAQRTSVQYPIQSVQFPIQVGEDMFPNIEENGEGWFRADFVPLTWNFGYEKINDEEDISELKNLSFTEKVEILKDRHLDALASYGWSDHQETIYQWMTNIVVPGCTFEINVGEFFDSEVQF